MAKKKLLVTPKELDKLVGAINNLVDRVTKLELPPPAQRPDTRTTPNIDWQMTDEWTEFYWRVDPRDRKRLLDWLRDLSERWSCRHKGSALYVAAVPEVTVNDPADADVEPTTTEFSLRVIFNEYVKSHSTPQGDLSYPEMGLSAEHDTTGDWIMYEVL